ncbi:MAG: type II/IV secretion system protein, partial [Candidatus Omnitrophica bacterium]|nr:type II/IV secretion system protein [Candidatus Omnitrophota bacterium]
MKLRRVCQCDVNPVLASSKAIMKTIEIHYPSTENIQEQSQTSPSSADSSDSEETSFKVKPSRTIPAFSSEDTENIEGEESEPGKPSRPRDKNIGGLVQAAKEAPVIRKVNEIIERAAKDKASDIHLQPTEDNLQVRYRIDGVLHDLETISKVQQDPIISRIKIMANIDIAERRLPQDGRIQIQLEKNDADIRVSTFPTIYGESVVMRILIKSVKPPELSELGFSKRILSDFANLIKRPNGIILATGPTGSGKTTTLYAGLSMVNTKDKNIMTLEDPVEYRLEGVRQSQVAPKAGLTFAKGLRSMLRQDPDIIMVGEIRDLETAEIAIHAALTGHLVLSTLHTNDAA